MYFDDDDYNNQFVNDEQEYKENDYEEVGENEFDSILDEYLHEDDDLIAEPDDQDLVAGIRDFERVGGARRAGAEYGLGTTIAFANDRNSSFRKLEQISKTPEDIFVYLVFKIVNRYNIEKEYADESISLMNHMNKINKKIKYINPIVFLFSLLVLNRNNQIDRQMFEKVYSEKASRENISKSDLLRYAIFIRDMKSNYGL